MKKYLMTLLILMLSATVYAAVGWETELTIKAGTATSRLVFGQQNDATDGIDGKYDVPAMLNGELQVAFVDSQQLWRDVRNTESTSTWTIEVLAAPEGEVSLSWDSSELPDVSLVDLKTGNVIDMNAVSSFTVSGPQSLEIRMEK